jgi:3-hydroxyisobutyrate dehydrogenase-like beta-hydroxyacid dehydrogenase
MRKIGFVGLGVMGAGMALNLLAKGFELGVFARDPRKAQAWGSAAPISPAVRPNWRRTARRWCCA